MTKQHDTDRLETAMMRTTRPDGVRAVVQLAGAVRRQKFLCKCGKPASVVAHNDGVRHTFCAAHAEENRLNRQIARLKEDRTRGTMSRRAR